jgi:hypothetical protein
VWAWRVLARAQISSIGISEVKGWSSAAASSIRKQRLCRLLSSSAQGNFHDVCCRLVLGLTVGTWRCGKTEAPAHAIFGGCVRSNHSIDSSTGLSARIWPACDYRQQKGSDMYRLLHGFLPPFPSSAPRPAGFPSTAKVWSRRYCALSRSIDLPRQTPDSRTRSASCTRTQHWKLHRAPWPIGSNVSRPGKADHAVCHAIGRMLLPSRLA